MSENDGCTTPTKEWRTVHVDCSDGICEKALLAACLDAAAAGGDDVVELGNRTSAAFVDQLARLGDGHKILVTEDETLCVGTDPTIPVRQPGRFVGSGRGESGTADLVTVCKAFAHGLDEFWESYPVWVAGAARSVLSEICIAAGPGNDRREQSSHLHGPQNREDDAHVHLYYLVAILQSLNSMRVRDASYSPIPGKLCRRGRTVQRLLSGMIVDPSLMESDVSTSCPKMSTTFGVAILRVLSGVASCPGRSPPLGPMVLEKFGSGTNAQGQQMSIILGSLRAPATMDDRGISHGLFADDALPSSSRSTRGVESELWNSDTVTKLEANLDDTTGEHLAFVLEVLMGHSALDAWVTPIVMKKGRPAYTLHCLCKDGDGVVVGELTELIFRHSTTLGVRIHRNVPRAVLDRSFVTVATPYGESARKGLVGVKISKFNSGEVVSRKAEFEHCKEISLATGVPLRLIAEEAVKAAAIGIRNDDNANRNNDDDEDDDDGAKRPVFDS
jgi:uncharacterized protein (DUF111 family)